jgi:hypothetical protein
MHYTDDDLLDRLYEAGRLDDHLEHCAGCRSRWEDLLRRRRRVLAPAPEIEAWLDRTHLSLGPSARPAAWLRPAAALATLILLAVLVTRPPGPPPAVMASGDSQFLNEIYALIQDDEPRAAAAVRALFETRQ